MTDIGHTVTTNLSVIQWSEDGTRVTKRHDVMANADKLGPRATILDHHSSGSDPWTQHFAYELRVNQLLTRHRPPVPTPRLVGHDRKTRTIEFEAIAGERLGPKFPLEVTGPELEGLVALATALRTYRHRPRWLRKLPIQSRLRRAREVGLIGESEYQSLHRITSRMETQWVFAHADINPSNIVVAEDNEYVLLDWEWAGLYPDGYDLAFLWFVLVDVPEARAAVESRVGSDPAVFWLCALIINLLHLEWFEGRFRPRHEATLEELLAKVLDASSL